MNGDPSHMPSKKTKQKKTGFTTIRKDVRDKIVAQALDEIQFSRTFKRGKIANWQLNEDLYYSKLKKTNDARANVDLARMQEFVHTLLSKIDTPLVFKYAKRKDAQIKRVKELNALKDFDSDAGFWDLKDIAAKKQMIIYGRAINSYFASSEGGVYKSHNKNVDAYNFLIDPSAGGIDIEEADYIGDYGISLSRHDIEGNKDYLAQEVKELLMGDSGNNLDSTEEKLKQENRTRNAQSSTAAEKEKSTEDKFVFWRWGTTYKGERYYLLLNEEGGRAIRVVKADELFGAKRWWYWSYSAYPDLTEFWTPSPCDYIREIFMAQSVSINQMLDNAEQINKPQRIVDVTAVSNLAEVKYKKNGIIRAKSGLAQSAIKIIETPSITTPISVFNILETIQQGALGVTDQAKGISDTDGRATIYEGNEEATQDRFRLFARSYTHAYKHFARLYEWGVRDHLVRKVAIDILGPEGIELVSVSRRDLFKKNTDDEFGLIIEATNSDAARSADKNRLQVAFLGSLIGNPEIDQRDLLIALGELASVEVQTMHNLLDKSEYGDSELRGEAARDLELIIDGDKIKPNRRANSAYKTYFVDYMDDNQENLDSEVFANLVEYVQSLQPVIVRNLRERAREQAALELAAANDATGKPSSGIRAPGRSQPLQDTFNQNT